MSYYTIPSQPAMATARSMSGFGALLGFGQSEFNSGLVWSDCQKGAAGNNAAGKSCGQAIQMALNKLGYGPLAVDGEIGSQSIAAIKQFGIDNGFGPITWPTQAAVIKMEELMRAGETPGPSEPIDHHVVGGQVVPGAAPGDGVSIAGTKFSTGTLLAVGAAAVLGIGVIMYASKNKKSPGPQKI